MTTIDYSSDVMQAAITQSYEAKYTVLFPDVSDNEYRALVADVKRKDELTRKQRLYEGRLKKCCRHRQWNEFAYIVKERPAFIRRFAGIFEYLNRLSDDWYIRDSIWPCVKLLIATPSFRAATTASVLTYQFVRLCIKFGGNSLRELIDTIITRRPTVTIIQKLFRHNKFSPRMVNAIERWTNETSYPLPFEGRGELPVFYEIPTLSRLLTTLHRQKRLDSSWTTVGASFLNAVASRLDDHTFGDLGVRLLESSPAVFYDLRTRDSPEARLSQFCHTHRLLHVMMIEQLLALVPLDLPVYVAIDILNFSLLPVDALSPIEYLRLVDAASRIKRAYVEAIARRPVGNEKRVRKPVNKKL